MICLVVVFASCGSSESPSDVTSKFMNALNERNYEEARKYSTKETTKLIELIESLSKLSDEKPPVQTGSVVIVDERIEGDIAYVTFLEPDSKEASEVKLKNEDGKWLVNITKEEISAKNAGFQEEDEGLYEEGEYTDMPDSSMNDSIVIP